MKIYLAVRYDRHVDDQYEAFRTAEKAIKYCKECEIEDYPHLKFNEEKVDGWEYFSTSGEDGPTFRVECIRCEE